MPAFALIPFLAKAGTVAAGAGGIINTIKGIFGGKNKQNANPNPATPAVAKDNTLIYLVAGGFGVLILIFLLTKK